MNSQEKKPMLDLPSNLKFSIEEGPFGEKLVVRGWWREGLKDVLVEKRIVHLELNQAKNWPREEIGFLRELEFLEHLDIHQPNLDDLSPIHVLKNLLSFTADTYCKSEIDFTCFPRLERCFLEWRPKAKSVFECRTLKYLYLNMFKGKDSSVFENLKNLETLKIGNGPLPDIVGLRGLSKLRELGLYNLRKLASLDGIQSIRELRVLDIAGCRSIQSIEPVEPLSRLEDLVLWDCSSIETLAPIRGLKRLTRVRLMGDTVVEDGDMSVFEHLPNLNNLFFTKKKHYSHKLSEFDLAKSQIG